MTVLLPVYMEFVGTPHGFRTAPLVLVYTLAIGLLMVSLGADLVGQARSAGASVARHGACRSSSWSVVAVAFLVSFRGDDDGARPLSDLGCLPFSWNAFHRRVRGDVRPAEA